MGAFLQSIHRIFDDGLAAVENRVELVGLELREEKWRLIETLTLILAAFFLAMIAVLLLTATVVFSFEHEVRPYVAAGFGAAYAISAICVVLSVKRRMKHDPTPLSDTADQLRKDRTWLDSLK